MLIKSLIFFSVFYSLSVKAELTRLPCHIQLLDLMSYQGRAKHLVDPIHKVTDNIHRPKIQKGIFVGEKGQALDFSDVRQFVYTDKFQLLVSKNPSEVDHAILGQGKDVYFAGLISFENGKVKDLAMHEKSAYVGSPRRMLELINFLEMLGVDLSQTKISMFFEEDPLLEMPTAEFESKYRSLN